MNPPLSRLTLVEDDAPALDAAILAVEADELRNRTIPGLNIGVGTFCDAIRSESEKRARRRSGRSETDLSKDEPTAADAERETDTTPQPLPILDLKAEPEPAKWIIREWIEESSITALVGRSKIGKSTGAAECANGIASNTPTCLGSPTAAFNTLWVDGDQGQRRCRRLFQRLGATDKPGLFVVSGTRVSLRDPEGVRRLEATIVAHGIRVVFLDSWSTLTPGADERSETEQTELIGNLRRIADEHGVSFVLIHHNRKESRDGSGSADPVEMVRGSTAIAACVDTIISARPAVGGSALDLAVVAARADERPQVRVERVLDGDTITLRPMGKPEVADTKQGRVETFIVGLFCDDDRILKKAAIAKACEGAGIKGQYVVNDACDHLVNVRSLWKPERGYYQLARYAPNKGGQFWKVENGPDGVSE